MAAEREWTELLARTAAVWALLTLTIGFCIALPDTFARWDTVQTLLVTQAVAGILALAVIFPLAVGEFDLSVGMNAGFTALCVAYLNGPTDWAAGPTVAAGLAIGPIIGLVNGLLIGRAQIAALVATLATATILEGLAIAISTTNVTTDPESRLSEWAQGMVLGELPVPALYLLAVAAVVWFLIDVTAWGRYLRVVGASPRSALLIGLPVERLRVTAFVVAGLFGGIAGVINTMEVGAASHATGTSLLLPAYAAAFVGATAIMPGRFNVPGTLVAVFLLAVGITGLQPLGTPSWGQHLFNGGALLIAVALPAWQRRTRPA